MSIAVSALVKPSRALRLLLVCAGLALLAAAAAVGLAGPARYLGAAPAALLQGGAGALLLAVAARRPKTHRIDISGTGELRVTVQQGVVGPERAAAAAMLLPGSVMWPPLMLLRYRAVGAPAAWQEQGQGQAAPQFIHVWRDSVDPATWRALAVALAVAGRRTETDESGILR